MISREIPDAASPTRFRALPNSTENSSTCRMLLSAKAPITDVGIRSIRKAAVPWICWPRSARLPASALDSWSRWMLAPLPIPEVKANTRPMTRAMVVRISK
ncbi:hypothetical protein D9M71_677300 [compost metagenome]